MNKGRGDANYRMDQGKGRSTANGAIVIIECRGWDGGGPSKLFETIVL